MHSFLFSHIAGNMGKRADLRLSLSKLLAEKGGSSQQLVDEWPKEIQPKWPTLTAADRQQNYRDLLWRLANQLNSRNSQQDRVQKDLPYPAF